MAISAVQISLFTARLSEIKAIGRSQSQVRNAVTSAAGAIRLGLTSSRRTPVGDDQYRRATLSVIGTAQVRKVRRVAETETDHFR
jgi:hypothetical protein